MSERNKTHNGRDLDGNFRVRETDVDDVLEDPEGAELIEDDVRLGGAVADNGPQSGQLGEEIGDLIAENRDDIAKVTGNVPRPPKNR